MDGLHLFLLVGWAGSVVLSLLNTRAAYRNGVTDGYGYSVEPNCPGYAAAGDYLREHMAYRWPSLTQEPGGDDTVQWETMEEGRKAGLEVASKLQDSRLRDMIVATQCASNETTLPVRMHQGCPYGRSGLLRVVGRIVRGGAVTMGCFVVCDTCGARKVERMM